LGYALRLKDDPERLEQRRAFIEDLLNMLGANRRDRFAYAETICRDREALREAYLIWLSFWRDLLLRAASPEMLLINQDLEEVIQGLAQKIDIGTARARIADLEQAVRRLDSNVNARLITEVILLDWPRVEIEL
jgi:hypothetical protein